MTRVATLAGCKSTGGRGEPTRGDGGGEGPATTTTADDRANDNDQDISALALPHALLDKAARHPGSQWTLGGCSCGLWK